MKYRTVGTDPATRREVSVPALGAMLFGSRTDEKTSFAVLDRYAEAGGTFVDTSDNYAFILYVLHTGIQWEHLPQDLCFGSGMTCWRRLRVWNEAGVRLETTAPSFPPGAVACGFPPPHTDGCRRSA